MRKEIIGICLLFLVVFTLISLLSYSDTDPSVFHNSGVKGNINNQFGIIGAHISGLFIGFFGLGALWIPFLFLLTGIIFLIKIPTKPVWPNITGGLLLVIFTGSLLALKQSHYIIWGNNFYAGGIVGTPLTSLFVKYANLSSFIAFNQLSFFVSSDTANISKPLGLNFSYAFTRFGFSLRHGPQ